MIFIVLAPKAARARSGGAPPRPIGGRGLRGGGREGSQTE